MSMRQVSSREYKLLLDQRLFVEGKRAAGEFWDELLVGLRQVGVRGRGEFDESVRRALVFLDTPDFSLRGNNVLLRRRREKNGPVEFTLKCRDADRYVANGANVSAAEGLEAKEKFEEDIGVPFVSRFSHSTTITFADGDAVPKIKSLGDAVGLFPGLSELERDGLALPSETALAPVNVVTIHEQVLSGPELLLAKDEKPASAALILWSTSRKGRPLVAEFSFRYKAKEEKFSAAAAQAGKDLFELLQRLDWHLPSGTTKTNYVYGGRGDVD